MKKDQTRVTFQCDKKLNEEMKEVAYISRITKTDIILRGVEMYISYLRENNPDVKAMDEKRKN